jgi:hypothetical protein
MAELVQYEKGAGIRYRIDELSEDEVLLIREALSGYALVLPSEHPVRGRLGDLKSTLRGER